MPITARSCDSGGTAINLILAVVFFFYYLMRVS